MDQRFHSAGRACCSIASMTGCISRSPNPRPGGADWNVRADELSAGRPPSMRWPMSAAIRAITTVGRHTGSPAGPMPTYFPISAARNCGRAAPAFIAAAMARWVEGTATLGPWQVNGDVPQSWLLELLDEGHSDRAVKVEPPPLARLSMSDLQDVIDQHPGQAAEFRDSVEIHVELGRLITDQMQKGANGDETAIFMALESVLRSIVTEMGSPKGILLTARGIGVDDAVLAAICADIEQRIRRLGGRRVIDVILKCNLSGWSLRKRANGPRRRWGDCRNSPHPTFLWN